MHRFPQYHALFFGHLFIIAVFASLIKVENLLSAQVNCNSQRIPVTIELVLDHEPDYSIPFFFSHGHFHSLPADCSDAPEQTISYRNAQLHYAQTVRVLLKINGCPLHAAVSLLLHRSLPGKSSDDGSLEIS